MTTTVTLELSDEAANCIKAITGTEQPDPDIMNALMMIGYGIVIDEPEKVVTVVGRLQMLYGTTLILDAIDATRGGETC